VINEFLKQLVRARTVRDNLVDRKWPISSVSRYDMANYTVSTKKSNPLYTLS